MRITRVVITCDKSDRTQPVGHRACMREFPGSRREAEQAGWTTGVRRDSQGVIYDYCPTHKPAGAK